MNIDNIKAWADNFARKDNRLSYETCLSEAVLREVIIELDNQGKIPESRHQNDKN